MAVWLHSMPNVISLLKDWYKYPLMLYIELRDVILHAFHGFYEGERETGSDYEIQLKVGYEHNDHQEFLSVSDTVDYTVLYNLVQHRMQVPSDLLENVVESIIRRIKHQYPQVKEIECSLYKLQPPIPGFKGKTGVTLRKSFHE